MLKLAIGAVLLWAVLFGLLGMPYWLLPGSVSDVLRLHDVGEQVAATPALWVTFAALAISQFWKAFETRHTALALDKLQHRVQRDFFALVARAVAMSMIAHAGLGTWLVPLMALALTYIEVGPDVQTAMAARKTP